MSRASLEGLEAEITAEAALRRKVAAEFGDMAGGAPAADEIAFAETFDKWVRVLRAHLDAGAA